MSIRYLLKCVYKKYTKGIKMKKKQKVINVRFDDDTFRKLRMISATFDLTYSEIIRESVQLFWKYSKIVERKSNICIDRTILNE